MVRRSKQSIIAVILVVFLVGVFQAVEGRPGARWKAGPIGLGANASRPPASGLIRHERILSTQMIDDGGGGGGGGTSTIAKTIEYTIPAFGVSETRQVVMIEDAAGLQSVELRDSQGHVLERVTRDDYNLAMSQHPVTGNLEPPGSTTQSTPAHVFPTRASRSPDPCDPDAPFLQVLETVIDSSLTVTGSVHN